MTHKEFVKLLAERLNMGEKEVATLTAQYVETIVNAVQSNRVVSIYGFGNFVFKEKSERKMYNPTTKSYTVIPSRKVLVFKMSERLKNLINKV